MTEVFLKSQTRLVRILAIGIFCLLASFVVAQSPYPVKIGILKGDKIRSASVSLVSGSYECVGDGKMLVGISAEQRLSFAPKGNLVNVRIDGKDLGSFNRVVVKSTKWDSTCRLTYTNSAGTSKKRVYNDHLIVRSNGTNLNLINETELERYVAGVCEAEAGKGHELEYYKVQAIISRTYALANMHRHNSDGFNLCDQVHCQVYHGKPKHDENIVIATYATKGHVLVDADINFVTAAFHSNCGGHTMNAEHVWSKPLPYLVGRPDTFCLVMPHSHWEKSIRKDHWQSYFAENNDNSMRAIRDSLSRMDYYPAAKSMFFADTSTTIKMTKLRQDFKLRSAFFAVSQDADSVRLTGRGFGHGVGLCQEGAMRMATLGYSSNDILHFYYKDVHLIDKEHLVFFREDAP